MLDNTITIDKDILLHTIPANSNGFIELIQDEELIRVGKKLYSQDEYLLEWVMNGRRSLKKQKINRIR